MNRPVRWYDYITVNIYFLGLTTLSQTNGLIIPLLVALFVGDEQKGAYFGTYRLWTLMAALLMQALWGMLSDRCKLRWGRRRPFIVVSTLVDLVFIVGIGLLFGQSGMSGFYLLMVLGILLQASSNAAQAAAQALIPDLVPESKRGRFSAVKAIFEIPLPAILVAFTASKLVSVGNIWGGLGVAMAMLVVTMLLTLFVPEQPLEETPPPLDWKPFFRLVLMTALFSAIILGLGAVIRLVGGLAETGGSSSAILWIMGLLGALGMMAAVGLGTWFGVRTSLGDEGLKHRSFTWWVINRLAFLVGVVNLSTFAVFYFQSRLGFAGETATKPAGSLIQIVGVVIFIAALPSGWLADRFGYKRILAAAGVLAALGTGVMLLTQDMTVIYLGGGIVGLAAGLFYPANWALGTELAPRDKAARYLGISNLAGAGAGAVGAYIGGPIADFFTRNAPQDPGLGYALLFGIYALLFLFSVAALTQIKKQ
ncbi:MAG TPA: MFS transporter [Anaerolineales bacterium]|nr:MFS transporter [Anaerolineales bacterium]